LSSWADYFRVFSAGVELGGVSVYLAEIATPGHKGFYCAWQSASQQLAVITAASLGVALSLILPPETMSVWGWRIPFLLGCLIIPFLFWLRRSLAETKAFPGAQEPPTMSAIFAFARNELENHRRRDDALHDDHCLLLFHYGLHADIWREGPALTNRQSLFVTFCVGLSNFIWLPIGGAISDKIGRRPCSSSSLSLL